MREEWKDVIGYEEFFMVSNYGKVWSKRTNKQLRTTSTENGYEVFVSRFNGRKSKSILFRVHRLVAIAFVENKHNKPYVNHIDGNKKNNYYKNLEWCTTRENIIHAIEKKLIKTKISKKDVGKIRKAIREGRTQHSIALEYGVDERAISAIKTNKSWGWVE